MYIVYKTTNITNGHIYVGVHRTDDTGVFDGYFGSGKVLKLAISKHGRDNFVRETLFEFDDQTSAYAKEAEIVTEEFLSRDDVYNLTIGGRIPPKVDWTGRKHSDTTKKRISTNRTGKLAGEEHWNSDPKHATPKAENQERLRKQNLERNSTMKWATGHVVSQELRTQYSEYNRTLRWWINHDTNDVLFSPECPAGYVAGRGSRKRLNKKHTNPPHDN